MSPNSKSSGRPALLVSALAVIALAVAACGGEDGGAAREGGGSGDGKTRVVEHAMGTTEISEKPKRVVTLDTGELDSAVALGVTPVGAAEAIPGEGLPDYLAQEVQGTRP